MSVCGEISLLTINSESWKKKLNGPLRDYLRSDLKNLKKSLKTLTFFQGFPQELNFNILKHDITNIFVKELFGSNLVGR